MDTDLAPQPSPTAEPVTTPERALIAPWWHTLSLIAVLLLVSLMGAHAQRVEGPAGAKLARYITTMIWQWLLFFYVWWGVSRRGVKLRDLIGGKWKQVEDVLIDIALAALTLAAFVTIAAGFAIAFKLASAGQVPHQIEETRRMLGFLIPRTRLELAFWFGLSITAGICEETLFRGYIQKQFLAVSGSAFVAIFGQGIIFGLAHGYQGLQKMVLIALLGILFGVLSHFRKSLRPAMIAHSSFDIVQGLLIRVLLK